MTGLVGPAWSARPGRPSWPARVGRTSLAGEDCLTGLVVPVGPARPAKPAGPGRHDRQGRRGRLDWSLRPGRSVRSGRPSQPCRAGLIGMADKSQFGPGPVELTSMAGVTGPRRLGRARPVSPPWPAGPDDASRTGLTYDDFTKAPPPHIRCVVSPVSSVPPVFGSSRPWFLSPTSGLRQVQAALFARRSPGCLVLGCLRECLGRLWPTRYSRIMEEFIDVTSKSEC